MSQYHTDDRPTLIQVLQAGKLIFFGTRPNWAVSYIAYTKFHLPRPVFHSPNQIFSRIGERASASFLACNGLGDIRQQAIT